MSPREIQVARELEIRGGFTTEQLACHESTGGLHYLTAAMDDVLTGERYRRCINCSGKLPGDYDNSRPLRAPIQNVNGVPTTVAP